MAITQKLAPTGIASTDVLFSATADTAVTSIHLCNLTSEDAVINIYLLPTDGSSTAPTENNKIYNTLTIPATDTYIVDTEKLILDTGDAIWIETPDSAGSIVATISTIGL